MISRLLCNVTLLQKYDAALKRNKTVLVLSADVSPADAVSRSGSINLENNDCTKMLSDSIVDKYDYKNTGTSSAAYDDEYGIGDVERVLVRPKQSSSAAGAGDGALAAKQAFLEEWRAERAAAAAGKRRGGNGNSYGGGGGNGGGGGGGGGGGQRRLGTANAAVAADGDALYPLRRASLDAAATKT
jgi:hypothetical protein